MTTPVAGAISVSQFNTEVGYAAGRASALNDAAFDAMRGSIAHPILMNQFYNKTNRILTAGNTGTGAGFNGAIGSLGVPTANGWTVLQLAWDTIGGGHVVLTLQGNTGRVISYLSIYDINTGSGTIYPDASASFFGLVGGNTQWQWFEPIQNIINGRVYAAFVQ